MNKIRKEKKDKKKLGKKSILLFIVIFVFLLFAGAFTLYKYKEVEKRKTLIVEIDKNYNPYVKIRKDTSLYTKELEQIGEISKDIDIEIVKEKQKDFAYYKVKDTEYYVYYKDVKKVKKLSENDTYIHYIMLNKNAETKKNAKLYFDDQKYILMKDSITLPIKFIEGNYYYVKYLNKLFKINEKDIKEVVESKNSEEIDANYISLIHYSHVADTCVNDDCVTTKSLEEQLQFLKENNYYAINVSEYKNWLNGNIRLKEKAILLMATNDNDILKNLNEKYNHFVNIVGLDSGIVFVDNNMKTTKESRLDQLSRYSIKSYTTIDNFQKMVLGENVVEVKQEEKEQTPATGEQKIAVINYHFFYDGSKEGCNENICLDIKNFREQLNYLRDNHYKTLTMDEYRKWMYGEIELPEKSVLLTIDDGAFGTGRHNGNHLIPILEEYKMHATLFLIAGWWDINNYRSEYLDIESHTFDMHNTGDCGKAQMICYGYDHLVEDLQKSVDVIGSKKAFCFPFYTYDDKAIQAVKDVGFSLAFIGGDRKSKRSDYNWKIPRYPIYKNTSLQQFIHMVS